MKYVLYPGVKYEICMLANVHLLLLFRLLKVPERHSKSVAEISLVRVGRYRTRAILLKFANPMQNFEYSNSRVCSADKCYAAKMSRLECGVMSGAWNGDQPTRKEDTVQ